METVTTLDDKVRAFKVLLDKKDELAEQTKANNEELKNLEQEIAQQMVDEEKPDTTVDGFKYSLQEKTRYSKISEEKLMEKGLVFFDVLKEQGFGHLITERVDPRTLDSAMNNLAAENDGELPEEMAEVLSVYSSKESTGGIKMDYEQMEIDITLESDRDLKENMQATAKFALGQIMEYQHPTKVKNRHEGYGIAAEGYASLQGKMKSTKTDMDDLLKLLPNGDGDVLNVIGSLYNSAVEVAVESIKLAAQAQRIMDDLYYGESGKPTPMEEYIDEQEAGASEDDGFEEADNNKEDAEEMEE